MKNQYLQVVFEIPVKDGWKRLGAVGEMEPMGSMSSDEPDGRQVYSFGWFDGDGPGPWRSLSGYDVANDLVREISSLGLEKLADLSKTSFTVDFWRNGQSMPVRFRTEKTTIS